MANYVWGYPGMWGYSHGVPYDNFHELNLDWVLDALQKFNADLKEVPTEIANRLQDALDLMEFDQIIADYLATMGVVNVKLPPNGLTPASGDGTTDDTATIQGCIDYLADNGGGTVFFPNGSYITQSVTLADYVSLVGMDRYSTDLVLKGGAAKALINGDVMHCSIRNIHLSGNSQVQTDNVNVVELTAGELLIDNVIINNGYELLSLISNGGNWQLSNIVMENAGLTAAELLKGPEHTNVVAENWNIGYISSINGRHAINNGIDNVQFTNVVIDTVVPTGLNFGANYCKFTGQVIGAVNPVVDMGEMNSFTIVGLSESVKYSGEKKEQAGSIERDAENDILDAGKNIMSNAQEKNTVSGTDVVLSPINPLTYNKTPEVLNKYFKTIPAKTQTGLTYDILVKNDDIDKLENNYIVNVTDYGAVGDNSTDNFDAITNAIEACPEGGYLVFPSGIYKSSAGFLIEKSINIVGTGGNMYGTNTNGNSVGNCTLSILNGDCAIKFRKENNYLFYGSVKNIKIYGNDNVGTMIHLSSTVMFTIENVSGWGFTANGILLTDDASTNGLLSQFNNINNVDFVSGTSTATTNCAAIALYTLSGNNLVTQNYIENVRLYTQTAACILIKGSDNNIFTKAYTFASDSSTYPIQLKKDANNNLFMYTVGKIWSENINHGNIFEHIISEGSGVLFNDDSSFKYNVLDYVTGKYFKFDSKWLSKYIELPITNFAGSTVATKGLVYGINANTGCSYTYADNHLSKGSIKEMTLISASTADEADNVRLTIYNNLYQIFTTNITINNTSLFTKTVIPIDVEIAEDAILSIRIEDDGANSLFFNASMLFVSDGPTSIGSGTYSVDASL